MKKLAEFGIYGWADIGWTLLVIVACIATGLVSFVF